MALTKVTNSMISGAALNVCDYGFSTTNTAAQNAAVINSLLPELTNGVELVIPQGTYAINPLVFENIFYITIRGIGKVNLAFTTGTAAITLGNAAHTKPVRRMILDNLRIIGSGSLTYGIRFLFGVDVTMYNIIIEDDNTSFINTALYLDYSWDNNFYSLITKSLNGIYFDSNEANKNSFFGGRFESTNDLVGVGVSTAGKANAMYGCDIEGWRYAVDVRNSVGFTLSGCYFEGNTGNDILFSGTGASYSTVITGCFFDVRTYTTDSIQQSTVGNTSDGVVIEGNNFVGPPVNAFIRMTSLSNNWFIAGNSFVGSSNQYSGIDLGLGNQIQNLNNTWTPVYAAGTSGTPTTTESAGRWIKQGRIVTAWFQIKGVANGATGTLVIGGLPFTAAAALNGRGYSGAISQALSWGTATPKTVQKGAANLTIDLYDASGVALTVANMGAGDNEVVGMVTYFAAN
jgi:hypothetical protein